MLIGSIRVVALLLYTKPTNNNKGTTRLDECVAVFQSYLYDRMLIVDKSNRTAFVVFDLTPTSFHPY